MMFGFHSEVSISSSSLLFLARFANLVGHSYYNENILIIYDVYIKLTKYFPYYITLTLYEIVIQDNN